MKRILCYGDSNTWGYNAIDSDLLTGLPSRYDEHTRWPGVMRDVLGSEYFVWEVGLGGRTTVFDDPLMPTRNGVKAFELILQTCDPVDCIIFALGTNDTKDMFQASSLVIDCGMERLLTVCKTVLMQSRSADAKIILACPITPVADGSGKYWYGFSEQATEKGEQLRHCYKLLAQQQKCAYIDLNDFAQPSSADGVHLDAKAHKNVGMAMAQLVRSITSDQKE